MQLKLTAISSGDNFYPKSIKDKLQTNLATRDSDDMFDVGDETPYSDMKKREYGSLYLTHHPDQFSKKYYDEGYEELFVEFFEKNYDLLISAGADDFTIFIDIYRLEYEQCWNFEIFNKDQLKILAKYNVSLPVSVYEIKEYF